jgi:hypothetical protein
MKRLLFRFLKPLIYLLSAFGKKRSLAFRVTTTFFFVFIVTTIAFYNDISDEYKILTEQRTNRLVQLLTQIQSLETQQTPDKKKGSRQPATTESERKKIIEALLQKAHESRDIDFYVLQKDGEIIDAVNTGPLTEGQRKTLNRLNEVQVFDNLTVATAPAGEIIVSAGYNRNWLEFRKRAFLTVLKASIIEIILVVALVGGLIFYFARDIRKLVQRLEMGMTQYLDVEPVSHESDRIFKTLKNFEDRFTQMESSEKHFKNQLFSAITHELNSKKVPPYDFACTMARVDLNSYSELNRVMDPAQFRKVIDHLFVECMGMVTRYGGFMSEYLGDEIIFYFKDDQWPRSYLVAVGCITQMHKIARSITEQYKTILPFELKFKSALSHGKLTVSKGARELEISGFPFIESVRILKEVKTRDDFIIVVSGDVARMLEIFVPSKSYAKVDLKGIGETEIFQLQLDDNLTTALESGIYEGLDRFRDSDSLVTILQWMHDKLSNDPDFISQKLRPILPTLFSIVGKPFPEPKVELEARRVLEKLVKIDPTDAATSSFLSLAGRLVAPDIVTSQLSSLLITLSNSSSVRIKANAVEAMGRLGLTQDIKAPEATEHNRVVANYMIATGTREFSRDLTHKLSAMLKGRQEAGRASALYAIGEIVQFHLRRNPVHFRSSEIFQSFMKTALNSLYDESEMVRRQALKMAAKVDDPAVTTEIEKYRRIMTEKAAQDRLAEMAMHYDPAA